MGCFNLIGWQSKLPICYNDEVFILVGIYKNENKFHQYAPGRIFTPVCLPIFGNYDDYGCITKIRDDENIHLIEQLTETDIYKFLKEINIDAFRRWQKEPNKKYKDIIDRLEPYLLKDNGYNPEEKFDRGNDRLCFIMEHRFMFDECKDDVTSEIFDNWIKCTDEVRNKIQEEKSLFYSRIENIQDAYAKEKLLDVANYLNFIPPVYDTVLDPNIRAGYLFDRNRRDHCSEMLLALYKNENSSLLFNDLKEDYRHFMSFFSFLVEHSYIFDIHNICSQWDEIDSLLPVYKRMITHIENRIKESNENVED